MNESLISLPELGKHRQVKIVTPPKIQEDDEKKTPAPVLKSQLQSLSDKKQTFLMKQLNFKQIIALNN